MEPKTTTTTPATQDPAAIIAQAVTEAVAKAVQPLREEMATALKTKATSHMAGVAAAAETKEERPTVTGGERVKAPEGISAARVMKAGMLAKMRGITPEAVLKGWGYDVEARAFENAQKKAMAQNILSDGGALVPTEYSTEIIGILRNRVAVSVLGARTVPMGASLEIPEQTNASSAFYVGENAAVTPSEPKTGGVRLTEKKLMALVPVSNDLIRNASIDAEAFVRDDVVNVLRLRADFQAIFGAGGEHAPRGIVNLVDAANIYDAVAVSPVAPTLAEVKRELAKAKRILKRANIPMDRLGWIMSPRTEEYLYSVTDGNGNSIFQAALDAGTLHGAPVVVTNQVPENLDGTTDASRLIFGDFAQFLMGESMAMEVEMFPNATYDSTGSGAIVSGISSDQSLIRAIQKHDYTLRYRKAFTVTRLRWGA